MQRSLCSCAKIWATRRAVQPRSEKLLHPYQSLAATAAMAVVPLRCAFHHVSAA